jgi:hypothetical protein
MRSTVLTCLRSPDGKSPVATPNLARAGAELTAGK